MNSKAENVDDYIAAFPPKVADRLSEMRSTIRAVATDAVEVISYAIPSYKLNGMLVSFAGWANHIGFYPGAGGIAAFKEELSVYKGAKGSVQFPVGEPLPVDLVQRIVRFRVDENLERMKSKKKK